MRNYEKSASFVRPNPEFGVTLKIIWENELFYEYFGSLIPSVFLTLNGEPKNGFLSYRAGR
jgi:hypothetical protein